MKRNVIETVLGGVVLLVALVFLGFSYNTANVSSSIDNGYKIIAEFTGTGGLSIGDSVQISGVDIGKVSGIELDSESYRAKVTMEVDNRIKLPIDSSALISSVSLLGGKYLELQPGSDEEYMTEGSRIEYTQAPQNLEQLLGKFIFSMDGDKKGDAASSDAAAPAPAEAAPVESAPEAPAVELQQPEAP